MSSTKLKVILAQEDITQKELCNKISDIDLMKEPPEPGIEKPVMSIIVNGKRMNNKMATMNKILNGINSIIAERGKDKKYTLDSIFGESN